MSITRDYLIEKARAAEILAVHDWIALDALTFENTSALVQKTYQSAVGLKVATIYAVNRADSGLYFTAHYESEGRNVLSTCTLHTMASDSDLKLQNALHEYCVRIDSTVGETYAMRLAQ